MRRPITKQQLRDRVEGINLINRNDLFTFELDGAYGGWRLEAVRKGGGSVDALGTGYVSKRELYEAMGHFLGGMQFHAGRTIS